MADVAAPIISLDGKTAADPENATGEMTLNRRHDGNGVADAVRTGEHGRVLPIGTGTAVPQQEPLMLNLHVIDGWAERTAVKRKKNNSHGGPPLHIDRNKMIGVPATATAKEPDAGGKELTGAPRAVIKVVAVGPVHIEPFENALF